MLYYPTYYVLYILYYPTYYILHMLYYPTYYILYMLYYPNIIYYIICCTIQYIGDYHHPLNGKPNSQPSVFVIFHTVPQRAEFSMLQCKSASEVGK